MTDRIIERVRDWTKWVKYSEENGRGCYRICGIIGIKDYYASNVDKAFEEYIESAIEQMKGKSEEAIKEAEEKMKKTNFLSLIDKKTAARKEVFPSDFEMQKIIENAKPRNKLVFSLMVNEGLLCSEVSGIEIVNGHYMTENGSTGKLSKETEAIFNEYEFTEKPFARYAKLERTTFRTSLRDELDYMKRRGIVSKVYTMGSFHEYFAYKEIKDINKKLAI